MFHGFLERESKMTPLVLSVGMNPIGKSLVFRFAIL